MALPFRRKPEQLEESSTNFDLDNVRPFLVRLRPLIESGFGEAQIEQVSQLASSMKPDEERELEFSIQHEGRKTTLRIRVFMDDIDAPDLYIFAPGSLSAKIGEEFDKFAEELGI